MRRLLRALVAVAVGVGGMLVVPGAAVGEEVAATPPPIQVVSTPRDEPGRGGDGDSTEADITPDGRYAVFTSSSHDLSSTPTAAYTHIYLRDTATGSIRLISAVPDGSRSGNFASWGAAISDDGSRVAFLSLASDLLTTPVSTEARAYLWSRDTARIELVSVATLDRPVDDLDLSGDGTTLAFVTSATNVAAIPTYNKQQIYKTDLASGEVTLISTSDTGTASVGGSSQPSISRDGTVIAFTATDMEVGGSSSMRPEVFRWSRSFGAENVSGFGNGTSTSPSVSADGGTIAFVSTSTDITFRPVNGKRQIFVREMRDSYPRLVSMTPHRQTAGDGESYGPALSADGHDLAYVSTATQLVAGADGSPQVYVGDIWAYGLRIASRTSEGRLANHSPGGLAVDDDASVVLFETSADNLVPAVTGQQVYASQSHSARTVERIGGADRYEVSAKISAQVFPPYVPVVYLASGEGYADALSGGAMAGVQSGPVLLARKESIPDVVLTELARLKPHRIVVLGGLNTIDEAVVSSLAGYATQVVRASGSDRYATSIEVLKSWARESFVSGQKVIVTSGENFPDALAGAALAGNRWAPVLLTQRDSVSQTTLDEITRIGTVEVLVLGGANSVSDAVVQKLGTVATTRRVGGVDRYAVAAALLPEFGSTSGIVYIASGENYPDALSASASAVQEYAPVLLVTKNSIPDATKAVLSSFKPLRIVVLGGPNTISNAVVAELGTYLRP
ncbi:cell wall-binding repeat-containing protein [Herbiconiux sp. KACC 21604]|uniref:cell wall-binding repeat-containing protein n=1 Tax=unclassified Herbiconiux TaxID=2618217 RepID=UPI0014926A98|nr:cell wall-binding repeat-containing protein [Herbiconiux sp. SALV-R1]QJU53318.1 cell wall-binding repeat-containing protein [Herbiconiux sp. SALV-R1]WPO88276.1 cell wall-binding repeat-containing protein [Herbiconiux sp. KACC 21604]